MLSFNGASVFADPYAVYSIRRHSQSKLPVMNNSMTVFGNDRVRRSIPMARKMMIVLMAAALAGGLGASDAFARGGGGGGHMGGGFGGGHMGGFGGGHFGGFGGTHLGGFGGAHMAHGIFGHRDRYGRDGVYGYCPYDYYSYNCYPNGG
jgi:hypothetical protein